MMLESNLKRGGLSSGAAWSVSWTGNGSFWLCDLKPSCLEVSALGILVQDLEMVNSGVCGERETVEHLEQCLAQGELSGSLSLQLL